MANKKNILFPMLVAEFVSMRPSALQPSPSMRLPSSHSSHPSITPLPITGGHAVAICMQDPPHHVQLLPKHFSDVLNLLQ